VVLRQTIRNFVALRALPVLTTERIQRENGSIIIVRLAEPKRVIGEATAVCAIQQNRVILVRSPLQKFALALATKLMPGSVSLLEELITTRTCLDAAACAAIQDTSRFAM
jgi:hypothetical protein